MHRFADTFFNRRNILFWNHPAFDLIVKRKSCTGLGRFNTQIYVTELSATARLFCVFVLLFDLLFDRFAVRNLRCTDFGFHFELTLHTVYKDLKVQLSHTGNDRLTRFFVRMYTERWIFRSQFSKSDPHFFLVRFCFWLNRNRDNRFWKVHTLQDHFISRITESITCRCIFQTDDRTDLTSVDLFYFLALNRVHLHNTPDTLFFIFCRVVNVRT